MYVVRVYTSIFLQKSVNNVVLCEAIVYKHQSKKWDLNKLTYDTQNFVFSPYQKHIMLTTT